MTAEIPTEFCSTIKTGSTHRELCTWGEICYLKLPCFFMRKLHNFDVLLCTLPLVVCGLRSIVMSVFVCLSVRLFARISQEPRARASQNFLCVFPVVSTRFLSVGIAIRYALPVLWMMWMIHIIYGRYGAVKRISSRVIEQHGFDTAT